MSRIPVSLIVGFLGSGKTTLLRHLLSRRSPGQHWACVVNEFGPVDVDGARLAGSGARIVPLAGGSIFCPCLVTQFMEVIRSLARTHTDQPLDGVFIEASGVADPRAVRRLFAETKADAQYTIATIVALVDPGTYSKLRQTLPTLQAQIEMADHLVLNKVDCHPEPLIRETEAELRQLNSVARLHRCSFGQVILEPFALSAESPSFDREPTPCRDPALASCHVIHHGAVQETRFRAALDMVREDLYRIKGHLRVNGRLQAVDYSGTGLVLDPVGETADGRAELVVIYRRDREAEVRQALLRPLVRGTFGPGC